MSNEEQVHLTDSQPARVTVRFTRSSQRDGKTGYEITVSDGATYTIAREVYYIAVELRDKAEALINAPTNGEK